MTSLSEAGRVIRQVKLGTREDSEAITVYGVTLDGVVLLLDRFPEFKELITPKRGELDAKEFTIEGLIKMGPRIMGAVIAAGTGEPGSEVAENAAKMLPIGLQVKIIKEIMEATFPGGLGPFVEDLRSMGLLGRVSTEDEQPDLPRPNGKDESKSADTGKAPATRSLPQPPASEEKATPKS